MTTDRHREPGSPETIRIAEILARFFGGAEISEPAGNENVVMASVRLPTGHAMELVEFLKKHGGQDALN